MQDETSAGLLKIKFTGTLGCTGPQVGFALDGPRKTADRLAPASFQHAGGISSEMPIQIFSVPRQYLLLWTPQPPVPDLEALYSRSYNGELIVECAIESARDVLAESFKSRHPLLDELDLAFNYRKFAYCLMKSHARLTRPAAVLVVKFGSDYSLSSEGLVYLLTADFPKLVEDFERVIQERYKPGAFKHMSDRYFMRIVERFSAIEILHLLQC